jgi:dTDP-4-amino-4,6-dideoxygalactose transaminase
MFAAKAIRPQVPFVDLKIQYAAIKTEIQIGIHRVLESAHFVGGEQVEEFEQAFARYTGAKYAVGVSSGTSALELALRASGIRAFDEVIIPANTFFATAEAVSNVGATPVFADVSIETFHLDVAALESKITSRTRAVIPVHLYGRAMDLAELEIIADDYGLQIIEDAAQAHGVGLGGKRVGSSGRLCCFSFYPGKNLGAYGDAGAVTTNDLKQLENLRILRDHGSPEKYQHSIIGSNARLDSIQAAVLSVKLGHLDAWNSRRVQHAKRYVQQLSGSGVIAPQVPSDGEHNFHLFVIRANDRDELLAFLQERGVNAAIHYPVPLHVTGAYQALGYAGAGTLPVAETVAREVLSLPMFPELDDEQIDYVSQTVKEFRL